MICQNRIDGIPCEHEAKFVMRPNPNCQNFCCNMYLCEYCAAYARVFTDDILDIEEGITFQQAAAFGDQQSMSKSLQLSLFADVPPATIGGK